MHENEIEKANEFECTFQINDNNGKKAVNEPVFVC